jgi:hypothetical protein
VPSSSTATADVTAQIQVCSAQALPTSKPLATKIIAIVRIVFVIIHQLPSMSIC